MKKLNLFAVGLIAMLMAAKGVSAGEIDTLEKLQSCLASKEPEVKECVLTKNITMGQGSFSSAVQSSQADRVSGTKILDLGGHTLTLGTSITLNENDNLTVKNGTIDASSSNLTSFTVDGKGILTFDGVTFKGNPSNTSSPAISGFNDGAIINVTKCVFSDADVEIDRAISSNTTKNVNVTITDTTIENKGFAVSVHGTVADKTNKIVLEGNTFTSEGVVMYAAGYAQWEIKSGSYTGSDVMNIRSGKVTIGEANLKATGNAGYDVTDNGGASLSYGAAVSVVSNNIGSYVGDVELYVNGGTLESVHGNAILEKKYNSASDIKEISLTGGTFKSGDNADYAVWLDNQKDEFIEAGTFIVAKEGAEPYQSNAVDSKLADGHDKEGNTIVGKPVTIKVTNIGGLNEFRYKHIKEITAVAGDQVNLLELLEIDLNNEEFQPDSKSHRYAVQYVLSNGTTGLDVFTMVANKDVTIELTLVEVDEDVKSSEVIPSTPGTDPTPGEPTNPDEPGRDPEAGEKLPENQPTGDNVMGSVAMGIAGLVGIVGSALVFDKKTNYNN